MSRRQTIVSEISKNWTSEDGDDDGKALIAKQFEDVIEANRQRCYALKSWQLSRVATSEAINETIVAVFESTLRGDYKPTTKETT